jgi:hypothetical protein
MNVSRSENPAEAALQFQGGTLLLQGLTARAVDRVFTSVPWVWDQRVHAWRADALHYQAAAIDARRLAGP